MIQNRFQMSLVPIVEQPEARPQEWETREVSIRTATRTMKGGYAFEGAGAIWLGSLFYSSIAKFSAGSVSK